MTIRLKFEDYTIPLKEFLDHQQQTVIGYLKTGKALPFINSNGQLLVPFNSTDPVHFKALDGFIDPERNSSHYEPVMRISKPFREQDNKLYHHDLEVFLDIRALNPILTENPGFDPDHEYEDDDEDNVNPVCSMVEFGNVYFRTNDPVKYVRIQGRPDSFIDDADSPGYLTGRLEGRGQYYEFRRGGKFETTVGTRTGYIQSYDNEHNFAYNHHPLDAYNGTDNEHWMIKHEMGKLKNPQPAFNHFDPDLLTAPEEPSYVVRSPSGGICIVSSLPTPELENVMTTQSVKTTLSNVVDVNKVALITATKLEIGGIALDLITTQVLKVLPLPLQMLIGENPAIKIAVANLVNLIISQTQSKDPRIAAVNEAMMTVAYIETLNQFNFQEMIAGLLNQLPADKLNSLVDNAEVPA